jgi:hypothetical protein
LPLKFFLFSGMTDIQRDTLEFIKGEDKLKIYQANVGTKSKPKKRYPFRERETNMKWKSTPLLP